MNDAQPEQLGRSVSVNKQMEEDGLIEALEEGLDPVLKGASLKPETKKKIVASVVRTVEQYETYHGPLPHPAHLAGYENVLNGAANRIIGMAEKEQIHRHGLERRVLKWGVFGEVLGQISGLLVSFGFIAGAVYCAYVGVWEIGVAMVGAGAGGIISALVQGVKKSSEIRASTEVKKTPAKKARQKN